MASFLMFLMYIDKVALFLFFLKRKMADMLLVC